MEPVADNVHSRFEKLRGAKMIFISRQIMPNRPIDKALVIELSKVVFENIHNAKIYLKLESYDAAAIVLRIAAASNGDGGISEAQLVRELGFSRATMNRVINRLIDTHHIKVIPNETPRRFVYNFDFVVSTYGNDWMEKRAELHRSLIDRCVASLNAVFALLRDSHFEKRK